MKKQTFALLLIVGTAVLLLAMYGRNTLEQKNTITTTIKTEIPKEVAVTLDKNGFRPQELTVKVGTAVRWKNESGKRQTVNSDDYPTNQLHKELNFGIFEDGSSVVYIFEKPGKYGYHNQLKPEQKGAITVSE